MIKDSVFSSQYHLFGIVAIPKHSNLNKWGFGNDSILGKNQQLEKVHRWGNVKRVRGEKKLRAWSLGCIILETSLDWFEGGLVFMIRMLYFTIWKRVRKEWIGLGAHLGLLFWMIFFFSLVSPSFLRRGCSVLIYAWN